MQKQAYSQIYLGDMNTQEHVAATTPEFSAATKLPCNHQNMKSLLVSSIHKVLRKPARVRTTGSSSEAASLARGARSSSRMAVALERLQQVLRFMTTEERRSSIAGLSPRMRAALLAFMEGAPARAGALPGRMRNAEGMDDEGHRKAFKGTDVRTIRSSHGVRYVAQLRIRHLRLYTTGQPCGEVASRHHMFLARFRNAVDSAGEAIWHEPTRFCSLFEDILRQHGISERDMGLSTFIYMRADQWIDRTKAITSPILSLPEAVALHARLLRARATSWDSLRKEWAQLLCRTQKTRARRLSLVEAEDIAEQAHRRHVRRRMAVAVGRVEVALASQDKENNIEAKRRARAQGVAPTEVVASKRRDLRQIKQARAEKWRWLCRSDLSAAEILQGPPQHLRLPEAPTNPV